jgi:hypothetical protein
VTAPEPVEPTPVEPTPAESTTCPTGHPVVDAALDALAETGDRPPAEQVAAYEETHRALSQTLSAIDQS